MAFSGGVFSLIAGNPVTTGTVISSTWANNTLSDIASGLTTCVLKDGSQTITAQIPFFAGSSAVPSIVFSTDTSTGFYRPAANVVGVSIAGTQVLKVGATGLSVTGAILGSATVSAVTGLFSTSITSPLHDSGSATNLYFTTNALTTGFTVVHITGASNFLSVEPNTAGNPPSLRPVGTDSDIGLNIASKGSGAFSIVLNGAVQAAFNSTVSATSYVTITGSETSKPLISTNTGFMRIGAVGQLTFPATQDASSNANTLDDYEEGTWTPRLIFGGNTGNQSYTVQLGRYTKIGREVFCDFSITINAKSTATGAAAVTGFPAVFNGLIENIGSISWNSMAAELTSLYVEVNGGSGSESQGELIAAAVSVSSTSITVLNESHFTGGSNIKGSIRISGSG